MDGKDGKDWTVVVTDTGCYGLGFVIVLPSHGVCVFELAVWYRGVHYRGG